MEKLCLVYGRSLVPRDARESRDNDDAADSMTSILMLEIEAEQSRFVVLLSFHLERFFCKMFRLVGFALVAIRKGRASEEV